MDEVNSESCNDKIHFRFEECIFLKHCLQTYLKCWYICIPYMCNVEKIDGIPLVFITGFFSWIIALLLNCYLENLYIVHKFRGLVSDSMLSSSWRAICHRPLWTNITGHNCAMNFLHIPRVFSKEHKNTFTLLVEYTLLIIIGPTLQRKLKKFN